VNASAAPRVAAVIPARSGSKGVPRKNLQEVGGVSLLARAVAAAASAKSVGRVIVTSDDLEILKIALRAGAETHLRSSLTASDTATSEAALVEVLTDPDLGLYRTVEIIAFLQCTSPFLRAADIDAVLAPVIEGTADTAFSATPFHGYLWAVGNDGSAFPVGHGGKERVRRQDEAPRLLETGAVYVMRVRGLLDSGQRFHGRTVPVEVDARYAMEIDEPHDLSVARALAPIVDGPSDRIDSLFQLPTLKDVDLVVLDFDGVFTDDRVLVGSDGYEMVFCDRSDGRAATALRSAVDVLVLSSETSTVVQARCDKLGLRCSQGHGLTKADALREELRRRLIDPSRVLYLGNDTNDVECLLTVGFPVVVSDAHPEARAVAGHVLSARGGCGAIRELTEHLLGQPI
jgi:YrbI family 3-deoxy-D-manno-octulosonate 8-phosphate phosphatase